MKTFAIAIALIVSEFVFGQETITVTVTNIPNDQGEILFGLYTESTFMKSSPDYHATSKVENHTATVNFENIPSGEYAVSTYQDENGNKKFDMDLHGRPMENYGISNNARGMYGPPSWEDAKFSVADEPVSLEIKY